MFGYVSTPEFVRYGQRNRAMKCGNGWWSQWRAISKKKKETGTVNWDGLITILIDLSNSILIYLSKTCLDQRPLDLVWTNFIGSEIIFFWLRHPHIYFSCPHLTVLCLFDLTVTFRGETFQMVSSGHLSSSFNLRFISANQCSDINQYMCVIQFPLGSFPSEPSTYWNVLLRHQTVWIMLECYQTVLLSIT